MLKKTKEQVLEDIKNAAYAAASPTNNVNITVDTYQLQNALQNAIRLNNQYSVQMAIADAVTAAFAKLIENTYFDAEFEEDIGLKS